MYKTEKYVHRRSKDVKAPEQGMRLKFVLAHHPEASRTLKNHIKFSSDNIVLRAYDTVKQVIKDNDLNPSNVYPYCLHLYNKKPVDAQGKKILRPQRVLAALCSKYYKERSTSSFMQDLRQLGKPQCRATIKEAFPEFSDKILDTVYKGTFLPSRTA